MAEIKISEISTTTTSPAGTEYLELGGASTSKILLSVLRDYILNYLTSLTAKTTLADADQLTLADSAASNVSKKITWANVMVAILAYTGTLTNKRITPRITTITSHATPTINTDNCDCVTITAQAEAITSMTTNLSGTPTNFQKLLFRIKDNGTNRAITWGASFEAKGTTPPASTTANKVLTVGFIYDTVTSKWGCVASVVEA